MAKKVCKRCVMDNIGDNTISFREDGTCNYCNYALSRINDVYFPNSIGKQKLEKIIKKLKKDGENKEYDCLMGLSGGLDSTYLAYLGAEKWGLKILAVHIDDGFNTDSAMENIEKLSEKLNIKVIIEEPDKAQYMDLIKSFIRSGVPGIDNPQDNILMAYLNKYAIKYDLKYFLSGANFSLESILQRGNAHVAADGVQIKEIHKQFGETKITSLPVISLFDRYIGQKYIRKIKTIRPLDFIDYNRDRAIAELQEKVDFDYYGGKHYESIYTKFVQSYYLPNKFCVDKRKSHLSSMIISGQIDREKALEELEKPLYQDEQIETDITYILNQIGMSREEFDNIMNEPGKSHKEYKMSKLTLFAGLARKLRKLLSD